MALISYHNFVVSAHTKRTLFKQVKHTHKPMSVFYREKEKKKRERERVREPHRKWSLIAEILSQVTGDGARLMLCLRIFFSLSFCYVCTANRTGNFIFMHP